MEERNVPATKPILTDVCYLQKTHPNIWEAKVENERMLVTRQTVADLQTMGVLPTAMSRQSDDYHSCIIIKVSNH